MRIRHLAAALAFAALAFTPARADVLIRVDKSAQVMTVTVDGAQLYAWPVSTGAPGYDTPSGEFKPFRMEAEHYSREWDDTLRISAARLRMAACGWSRRTPASCLL